MKEKVLVVVGKIAEWSDLPRWAIWILLVVNLVAVFLQTAVVLVAAIVSSSLELLARHILLVLLSVFFQGLWWLLIIGYGQLRKRFQKWLGWNKEAR